MKYIQPSDFSAPPAPLSPGVVSGNLLFVSGQVPLGSDRELLGADFAGQVRATLDKVARIAREAGTSLEHTVKIGVFISSPEHFQTLNSVFEEYFTAPFPARTTISAALRGFDVEIEAVIYIPGPEMQ